MSPEKESPDKASRKQYFTKVKEDFPEILTFGSQPFLKRMSMRYGENPGYPAAFYIEEKAFGANMATLDVLQEGSKGLGYINVGDMDLGQRLARKLTAVYPGKAVCVMIKHEIPSGVALGDTAFEAYEKAWNVDTLSNFGSVDVFNVPVTPDVARLLVESARNLEVVYAPGYADGTLEILAGRKPLRVVRMGAALDAPTGDNGLEFKRVAGGLLVQQRFDSRIVSPADVDFVSTRKPTDDEIQAAILAWNVAAFTRSNAVVIGTKDKIHGIGSGQRSRIDSTEDAIRLSRRGYGPEGCVLASDAYMPFPDVVETAAKNGLTAIIYPLGSIRDREVIDRANELGLAMIITRRPGEVDCERCFLHR
jgi:phosphoribosylaminoimidazolecarboxamide formyltransferase/IMP cyclohydrolase